MTLAETARLIRLISTVNPGFAPADAEATARAWQVLLADIPYGEAASAVGAHFRTGGPWISPGDIVRRVADARGLLPPDVEEAFAQAKALNRWLSRRAGEQPEVHPVVLDAARTVGWAVFDANEADAHRRFAAAYRSAAARDTERVLASGVELPASPRRDPVRALPAGRGALPAAEARGQLPAGRAVPPPAHLRQMIYRTAAATKVPR